MSYRGETHDILVHVLPETDGWRIANIIYDNVGVANNLPLAAAAALFPVTVIILYLLAVRRTGALENL